MLKISMDTIYRMTPEHLFKNYMLKNNLVAPVIDDYIKFYAKQNTETTTEFQKYREVKLEKRYKFLVSYIALNDKYELFPFHGYATFPNKNITEKQMEECLEKFKNKITGEVTRITLTAISFLGKIKV